MVARCLKPATPKGEEATRRETESKKCISNNDHVNNNGLLCNSSNLSNSRS